MSNTTITVVIDAADCITPAMTLATESRWIDRCFDFEQRYGFTLSEARAMNTLESFTGTTVLVSSNSAA